jgi:hypothetical protein
MSYARFASAEIVAKFADDPDWQPVRSDVYVFLSVGGFLECCSCRLLTDWQSFSAAATAAMLAHLREHIAAGHVVPPDTISAIEADRVENDAFIAGKAA